MSVTELEKEKYDRMWMVDDYRANSPGARFVPLFLELMAHDGQTVLDAGCGTGRAGQALAAAGYNVTLMDLSPSALEVPDLPFIEGCLWDAEAYPCRFDLAFCCDTLEHIPTEFTMLVIQRLLDHADSVFLSICTEPDNFGIRIGEPLHLTVQPFTWWRDHLRELGDVVEARDLGLTSVFVVKNRRSHGTD